MKPAELSSRVGEYQSRINRVMDYMESNLAETHTLEELAKVALFSKFHFHRIFQAMTGETPFQFLTRLRTAKAASLLRYSPSLSISEIGYQSGFSTPALFSRTFRQYFGVAPGAWRKMGNLGDAPAMKGIPGYQPGTAPAGTREGPVPRPVFAGSPPHVNAVNAGDNEEANKISGLTDNDQDSPESHRSPGQLMNDRNTNTRGNPGQHDRNFRQILGNDGQARREVSMYFCHETKTLKWRTNMELNKSMEVKELPKMTVAYIRHTGPYQGNSRLFGKLIGELCTWAGPRGLLQQNDMGIIIIYHDDPKVTEQEKLRMSVSIKVAPGTKVDGKVGKMEVPAGTFAVGRFEVGETEFGQAWEWLYGTWLPQSGYQPDDGPCFEIYPEQTQPGEKFKVDLCVPVKPL
jgi:DNA gyrase inhibitor GyrI/AraC-like DNA-binding protein